MKVLYVMVLVLVAGAVPSHGRTESGGTVFKKTQPHESKTMNNVTVSSSKLETYGHLYLAMQWPSSFCNYRQCNRQAPSHFTVHGLWPQYDPSIYSGGIDCLMPIYRRYPRFNILQLNREPQLVSNLNDIWPDLTTDENRFPGAENTNKRFWESEYNKHGSCTFKNENEYFGLTLAMVQHLGDLISMLSQISGGPIRRIVPGQAYSPIQIRDAVYMVIHKTPTLHCIRVGNNMQLLEIRFCAHQDGNLIDCHFRSNCGNSRVYLPRPSALRP